MKIPILAIGILTLCSSFSFSQSLTEEAILEKFQKGPDTNRALDSVLEEADQYSATVLFFCAKIAFDKGRLEDSGFLFYAAQLRYRFDMECFTPKGRGGNSPFQFYAVLSNNIGMVINPAIMAEPLIFAKAISRVKKWIPKSPEKYDPGYEFLERKSEEEAAKAVKSRRENFINGMTDLSTLLSNAEYFAASQVIREYNFSVGDNGPTVEEYDNATATMKQIEKSKGLKGFFSEEEPRNVADKGYKKVNGVWHYYRREIKGAHSETFEVIGGSSFAKDFAQVYVEGYVVPGADPKSFTVIKGPYGKDKRKVFCGTIAMNVHDVDAFEVVSWDGSSNTTFGKDFFILSYGEQFDTLEISEEKPALTGDAVSRDGIAYYYGPARIEDADYDSFRVGKGGVNEDKNQEYTGPFPTSSWPERRKKYPWP